MAKHLTEEKWRNIFADFTASGLSAAKFMRLRDINPSTFYKWRMRLGVSDNAAKLRYKSVINTANKIQPVAKQRAIPVNLLPDEAQASQSNKYAQIICPSGLQVNLPLNLEPQTLRIWLEILR